MALSLKQQLLDHIEIQLAFFFFFFVMMKLCHIAAVHICHE